MFVYWLPGLFLFCFVSTKFGRFLDIIFQIIFFHIFCCVFFLLGFHLHIFQTIWYVIFVHWGFVYFPSEFFMFFRLITFYWALSNFIAISNMLKKVFNFFTSKIFRLILSLLGFFFSFLNIIFISLPEIILIYIPCGNFFLSLNIFIIE